MMLRGRGGVMNLWRRRQLLYHLQVRLLRGCRGRRRRRRRNNQLLLLLLLRRRSGVWRGRPLRCRRWRRRVICRRRRRRDPPLLGCHGRRRLEAVCHANAAAAGHSRRRRRCRCRLPSFRPPQPMRRSCLEVAAEADDAATVSLSVVRARPLFFKRSSDDDDGGGGDDD